MKNITLWPWNHDDPLFVSLTSHYIFHRELLTHDICIIFPIVNRLYPRHPDFLDSIDLIFQVNIDYVGEN